MDRKGADLSAQELVQVLPQVPPVGRVVLKEAPIHSNGGRLHAHVQAVPVYLPQQPRQAGCHQRCAAPGHQPTHLLHLHAKPSRHIPHALDGGHRSGGCALTRAVPCMAPGCCHQPQGGRWVRAWQHAAPLQSWLLVTGLPHLRTDEVGSGHSQAGTRAGEGFG